MQTYNADSIQVLEGLDPVRKRPGMYIGSTGSKGLHHLVWEIVDNSIDEHLAEFCDTIKVTLNKDGSVTVEDNGRGVPIDKHKKGVPAVRLIYTVLHAGGKFDKGSYKVSGGLHGVGASVVNALSKWMTVEIHKDGYKYLERYENGGNPVTELKDGQLIPLGTTNKSGTIVTFLPDDSIFETTEYKPEIIKKRIKELSYLNKNLTIIFTDKNTGEVIEFHESRGIVGFIKDVNKSREVTPNTLMYIEGKSGEIEAEIALEYTKDFGETILSFCNNINTVEGGNHVSGFKSALTRLINQYAREIGMLKEKDQNLDGQDIRNGLTAIISIRHPEPQYEGQTKTKLGSSDAKSALEEIFNAEGQKFLDKNLETLKTIIDNAIKSFKIRKAEESVRINLRKKGAAALRGKLADCQTKDTSKAELFIVEGDSAGGSAKQGRDRNFQAILPLKGKPLNVEKSNIDKVLNNSEVATFISALGCGIGEGYGDDFDIEKLKYDKVIIMSDADVDGAHIRTLLLTLIYRFMPELIYNGKVYIAMPPLYKVKSGKQETYLYDDKELIEYKKKIKDTKFEIQRYKGLGEMNPDQLWSTTLNPKTRRLKQVIIEDMVESDEITSILMGSDVDPRRKFIEEEATYADIDV